MATLSVEQIRQQFSCFREENPPVYLDNAATAQMPDVVLEAMNAYYTNYKGNVHRGMHEHTAKASDAYEHARKVVQKFVNADDASEIIFTKNCTEAINLAAWSWGFTNVHADDAVVLSLLEHHSNIVPWQQLQQVKQHQIHWIDIDDDGDLMLSQLNDYLNKGTVKLVAITGQSNVLGTKPDLEEIISKAHAAGAKVLVDAAQLVVHQSVDVQKLDCDFLVFSGHKLYGPTGIGVLYAKQECQETMVEFLGGGGMINQVQRDGFTTADSPAKFEAGTPPIAQTIGLSAGIEWLSQYKWTELQKHEQEVLTYAIEQLSDISGLTMLGSGAGCSSFVLDNIHPHDLTDILGQKNIALRAGHHCTQPLHDHLGIPASTRVSLALYNTKEEIDILKNGIAEAMNVLQK